MQNVQTQQDKALARDLIDAVAARDDEWMQDCENVILERLNVSLDETEQGLTKNAVAQIETFVTKSLGYPWTYSG